MLDLIYLIVLVIVVFYLFDFFVSYFVEYNYGFFVFYNLLCFWFLFVESNMCGIEECLLEVNYFFEVCEEVFGEYVCVVFVYY